MLSILDNSYLNNFLKTLLRYLPCNFYENRMSTEPLFYIFILTKIDSSPSSSIWLFLPKVADYLIYLSLAFQLIRSRYPFDEKRLFDDVLGKAQLFDFFKLIQIINNDLSVLLTNGYVLCPATFVLHHPEHGHAVVLPIISIIIDGTLVYDKERPPFASFISLFCPNDEVYLLYFLMSFSCFSFSFFTTM